MGYLYGTYTDRGQIEFHGMHLPPMGGGFTLEQCQEADKLEVTASRFSDPGTDYSIFRLYKGDQVIAESKIEGY